MSESQANREVARALSELADLTKLRRIASFNAVSNFYGNLEGSGFFADIKLGRVYDIDGGEGVVGDLPPLVGRGGGRPVRAFFICAESTGGSS